MKSGNEKRRKIIDISIPALFLVAFILIFLFWWPGVVGQILKERADRDEMEGMIEDLPYLRGEEAVIINSDEGGDETEIIPVERTLFEYIEVVDSCGPYFEGECLNVRSGPGLDFSVLTQLREGQVLKVGGKVERNGDTWYRIVFDEWIRYPERVQGEWYVISDHVDILYEEGVRDLESCVEETPDKTIVVTRSEQKLYAYEDEELVMEFDISTGVELTPTPRGEFNIFRKTPTRYMQGPLPGITNQYWDLPGVPWNLYFTRQGAVIHGAYWHDAFGSPYSSGCVNVRPDEARKLYNWAQLGTKVIVRD